MMAKLIPVTKQNCKRLTGLLWEEIVDLTGIRGIDLWEDKDIDMAKSGDYVNVQIKNEHLYFYLRILTPENNSVEKKILNSMLVLTQPRVGCGTRITNSQIKYARKYGYDHLACTAHKRKIDPEPKKCVGYFVWAKLGYVMGFSCMIKFQSFLEENKITPLVPLNDLMTNVPNGYDLWYHQGFEWRGHFDLAETSLSNTIFSNYIVSKGIAI